MRIRFFILFSVTTLLAVGITYAISQPSLECVSQKDVAKSDWDKASTAKSLSTDIYLRNIYGDFQNSDSELKYEKSLYELRKIEHLATISASKRTLENQECFSDTEITNAQRELKVQKSFEEYFTK